MGIKDYFNKMAPVKETLNKVLFFSSKKVEEAFKAQVQSNTVSFPKDLGEAHPFDPKITEGVYKKFGMVTGAVDKYVDFIVGSGFFVTSENAKAQKIIEQFIFDTNFDTVLRAWIKEALVKPAGFIELGGDKSKTVQGVKVLNANFIYVKRDDKGVITGYNQYVGGFDKFRSSEMISFAPWQIAQLNLNQIGDDAYGQGIVYPAMTYIDNLIGAQKSMHTILKRKANSPIHAKIGQPDKLPTQEAVQDFGQKLEVMGDKTEWTTDANVDIKVLDFGGVGDKFSFVLDHDIDMMFFTFQIPEVLMGRGNIPEGLAGVQMDAFQRNIQSKQSEIERVIETQIFKRILESNGLGNVHVEFEWGQPTNFERYDKVSKLKDLLSISTISGGMRDAIEDEVAKTLGLDVDAIKEQREKDKELQGSEGEEQEPDDKEMKQEVPKIPGQKQSVHKHLKEEFPLEKDFELSEWLNFNYKDYLDEIKKVIKKDEFRLIKAYTDNQLKAGYLSQDQVEKVRKALLNGFAEGKSIKQISKEIYDKADLKPLYQMEGDELKLDEENNPILKLNPADRSVIITRSEATRVSAEGAKRHFQAGGVTEFTWVAAETERTCDECATIDGNIFEMTSSKLPPLHPNCRCTISPYIRGLSDNGSD